MTMTIYTGDEYSNFDNYEYNMYEIEIWYRKKMWVRDSSGPLVRLNTKSSRENNIISFELKNLENKNINEICDKVMSMSDEDIKAQVEAKKLNLL